MLNHDHRPTPTSFRDVLPSEVAARAASLRIIDVREPGEFVGDLGHIAGAELVPLATLARAAPSWARDQEIVVVCRSGGRSARAASELVSLGFGRVRNLLGGMSRWSAEGRPVSHSRA